MSDGKVTSEQLKEAARRVLTVLDDDESGRPEPTAVVAQWPEAVASLTPSEREARVRRGIDSILLDSKDAEGQRQVRGFVRVVLRVPLGHPDAQVYGVFVELERDGYLALKKAHQSKEPAQVWGKLANRLPLLEDAFETELLVEEDGSDRRARVVDAKHKLVLEGPEVGPMNGNG